MAANHGDGSFALGTGDRGRTLAEAVKPDQVGVDDPGVRHHRRALQAVLQLAHVARPGVLREAAQRGFLQGQAASLLLAEAADEEARQIGNVLATLAQRGQRNGHDVEAVVKVFAEIAGVDRRFEIAVGGGDDAHINLDRPAAADALEFTFLQHAQHLGLEGRRDLADLVEEQGAAVGGFEATLARADRAGEGALLVAEEFGFEQVLRQRRTVEPHVGAARTRRVVVDGVGDEFLAGTGFATDQHRGVPLRHHAHLVEDAPHFGRMADDVVETVAAAHGTFQAVAFLGETFLFLLDLEREAHALADQVGDHLDKARLRLELSATRQVGLHREHTERTAGGGDRRGDERQGMVVDAEPVEEARVAAGVVDDNGRAAVEHLAEHALAGLVAHRREGGGIESMHRDDRQIAAVAIDHANQATPQAGVFQHFEHLAQGLAIVERTRQHFADMVDRVHLRAAGGGLARRDGQRHDQSSARRAGSMTHTRQPPAWLAPISMVPPWSLTTCCAIARPVPA